MFIGELLYFYIVYYIVMVLYIITSTVSLESEVGAEFPSLASSELERDVLSPQVGVAEKHLKVPMSADQSYLGNA